CRMSVIAAPTPKAIVRPIDQTLGHQPFALVAETLRAIGAAVRLGGDAAIALPVLLGRAACWCLSRHQSISLAELPNLRFGTTTAPPATPCRTPPSLGVRGWCGGRHGNNSRFGKSLVIGHLHEALHLAVIVLLLDHHETAGLEP